MRLTGRNTFKEFFINTKPRVEVIAWMFIEKGKYSTGANGKSAWVSPTVLKTEMAQPPSDDALETGGAINTPNNFGFY